jgi:hypothetical protein
VVALVEVLLAVGASAVIAQRLEALRQYATREGYEILEEVQDPGQSGASLERPGMDHVRKCRATARHLVTVESDVRGANALCLK